MNTQARLLAGENIASVANFGMAARSVMPRTIISNELGNDNQVGNIANFNTFSRQSRTASNGIAAVDRLVAAGGTLGSTARNARAKAFGFLMLAEALGNLSLAYDSAAIVTPATPSEEVPGLSSAADVNAAALRMLDSAIAQARLTVSGSNGFPLPATWLNGQPLTADNFVRFARSLKARYRAGVARSPAQRAAVNWQEVIGDATNGITADFTVNVGGGSGWAAQYDMTQMYVTGGWHMIPYFYYGMADVSGAYDAWLATTVGSRKAFVIVTPDKRWPAGNTRAEQQAAGPTNALPPGVYFRNRPSGDDVVMTGPADSFYDHRRYGASNLNNSTGPYVEMSKTEVDMLAAEGYIRTGNIPAAVALINVTRVKNGLESIPSNISASAPISSSATCVPRVPQAPSFTSTACWDSAGSDEVREAHGNGLHRLHDLVCRQPRLG